PPSACSARMTRAETSPRFAIRTRENTVLLERVERLGERRLEVEERLAELDGLPVLDVDDANDALDLGLHLVHQLHRLEDAERLADPDGVALFHEGGRAGLRRSIERADHRRLDAYRAVRGGLRWCLLARGSGSRGRRRGRHGLFGAPDRDAR